MELLPTIVIVALLAFVVILTIVLFTCHWRHKRVRRRKRASNESYVKAPRQLTLRDGKAIPASEAADTASTREPYSIDSESLDIEKRFDFDAEKGFTKQRSIKASRRDSRPSLRSPPKDRQSWTPGRPPWLQKTPEVSKRQSRELRQTLKPPVRSKVRDRSRSIPRPALINIERRGSSQTRGSRQSSEPVPSLSSQVRPSDESGASFTQQRRGSDMTPEIQQKRRGIGITESLYNAYKGSGPWSGQVHDLPPSTVVLPGPAKTVAGSIRHSGHRWSMPTTASVHSSIPTTASFVRSSRAVSQPDSIRPPPPLFSKVNYSPHVSFAPTQDVTRQSFLSMTDSPTSSTSTERAFLGPRVPHSSMPEPLKATAGEPNLTADEPNPTADEPNPTAGLPAYNEQSRPMRATSLPTPDALEMVERVRRFGRQRLERPSSIVRQQQTQPGMNEVRERPTSIIARRPPSIEVDIPHTEAGSMSFFESIPTPLPTPSNFGRGKDLTRGPSVMSNRSVMTIASSEISSNWTIGKAEVVNIYPSVADEDLEQEGKSPMERPSPSERVTPPYAKMLRSKFGQYPKGRRDKALPTLPKSPLSQFPPGF